MSCTWIESESLRKEKLLLSYHDRNPLTCWQDSKHFFHLATLAHDLVIAATQVATARLDCSMHYCEDSCCLMLSQWLKKMNHYLCRYCLLTGLESHLWRECGLNQYICSAWLVWWHLVHDHTSHISAVPVIIVILMWCCTQESCSRIKGIPSYSKTPTSSTRVTSMFLPSLLTAQKVRRRHVLRLVSSWVC